MTDFEEQIRDIKRKLFDSSDAVPRTLLEVLHKHGVAERPCMAAVDYTKMAFTVYWLDGQVFRRLTWSGEQGPSASLSELAYPLSALSSVETEYTLNYDDYSRRHDQWDRHVTLHFGDDSIAVDVRAAAAQDTDTSRFVDAVLTALAGG